MNKCRSGAATNMMVGQQTRQSGSARDASSSHGFVSGKTTLKASEFARTQKLSATQDGNRSCIIRRGTPTESLGVQIGVSKNTRRPRVTWLLSTGLARGSGLLMGDYIVSINGNDCAGSTNADVVKMIQDAGTEIFLVVNTKDSGAASAASPAASPADERDTTSRQNRVLSKVLSALPHVSTTVAEVPAASKGTAGKPPKKNASKTTTRDKGVTSPKEATPATTSPPKSPGRKGVNKGPSHQKKRTAASAVTGVHKTSPQKNSGTGKAKSPRVTPFQGPVKAASVSPPKDADQANGPADKPAPVWRGGVSSKKKASDLFSYVTPLTRGTKFEEKSKPSKYKAFWEKDDDSKETGVSKKSKSTSKHNSADAAQGSGNARGDGAANGNESVAGPAEDKRKSNKDMRPRNTVAPSVTTAVAADTRAALRAEKQDLTARVQRMSHEEAGGDADSTASRAPTLPSLRDYIAEQRRRKVNNGGVLEFEVSITTNQHVEINDYDTAGGGPQTRVADTAEQPGGVSATTGPTHNASGTATTTDTADTTEPDGKVPDTGDGTPPEKGDSDEALLTWEAVEKMGATIDEQHMEVLNAVLAERDEARVERNELLSKLVAVTDSYEELLTSKEMEVQLLTLSQTQLQGKIDDMQSGADRLLPRDTPTDTPTPVAPDADGVIAQASVLMEAAASEKESLEASVQDMKTMVTALEDAVQAKDRLLRLRQQAREDDAAEFDQRIHEAVEAKEHEVRTELAATVAKLTSDLEAMQDAYLEAAKRPATATSAVASDTSDAPEGAEGGAAQADVDGSVLDSVTQRLHATLAALEAARAENADITQALAESADKHEAATAAHAAALEELRAEIADMASQREAAEAAQDTAHTHALEEQAEEHARRFEEMETNMATAMELAQAEVDKLLATKQEEIDMLLDDRDATIASLRAEVAHYSATNSGGSGNEDSVIDAKNREIQMKDQIICKLQDTVTVLEDVNSLEKEGFDTNETKWQAMVEQVRADGAKALQEKDAEVHAMMEQMQEALQEAMSAKGDLLCLDECANVLVAKEIEKRTDDELELLKSETAGATLARLELALAGTDPSVNREVIRLKLEIARLRHEGVSEEVVAKLTGMTEHVSSLVARRECHEASTQTTSVTVVDCETLARANEGAAAAKLALVEYKAKTEHELEFLRGKTAHLEESLARNEQRLLDFDAVRRKLLNEIHDLKGNTRVFCRVRPLLETEVSRFHMSHLVLPTDLDTGKLTVIDDTRKSVDGSKKQAFTDFEYNKIFAPEATQAEVFAEVEQLIDCAVMGQNVCIFAYGQTGSGKTYTMSGNVASPETRGIMPRAVEHLFSEIERMSHRNWMYTVKMSFLEIYNDQIRDLLTENSSIEGDEDALRCDVRLEKNGSLTVTNLEEFTVSSSQEVLALLGTADTHRAVAASEMNARSSRSHSVCRIVLTAVHRATKQTVASKINMVDLAGSERLTVPTPAMIDAVPLVERPALQASVAVRTAETLHINKSLSTLALVFQALRRKRSGTHVPYRDSKLTFLLQDSLCGDSKNLMLVNVSPREDCLAESLCSLRFASKVNATVSKAPAAKHD
eukprot:m.1241260 g.1241260  ORF g.1241260 m.1241260 type:complete len:1584 (+) comp24675_c0_seq2:332-5083(+)